MIEDEIKDFLYKFNEIKKLGYVKAVNNSFSGLGYTFENLMGLKNNDCSAPDFKNIEIKTKMGYNYKKSLIGLFSLKPSNEMEVISQLVKSYGYSNSYGGKNLCGEINSIQYNNIGRYRYKLNVNYNQEKIFLSIKNSYDETVNQSIYWDFDSIWPTVLRKLSFLALVKAWPKKIDNDLYYNYFKANIYKLITPYSFASLIDKGIISLKISIGTYHKGPRAGKMYYHGCIFCIKEENFKFLFKKLY